MTPDNTIALTIREMDLESALRIRFADVLAKVHGPGVVSVYCRPGYTNVFLDITVVADKDDPMAEETPVGFVKHASGCFEVPDYQVHDMLPEQLILSLKSDFDKACDLLANLLTESKGA